MDVKARCHAILRHRGVVVVCGFLLSLTWGCRKNAPRPQDLSGDRLPDRTVYDNYMREFLSKGKTVPPDSVIVLRSEREVVPFREGMVLGVLLSAADFRNIVPLEVDILRREPTADFSLHVPLFTGNGKNLPVHSGDIIAPKTVQSFDSTPPAEDPRAPRGPNGGSETRDHEIWVGGSVKNEGFVTFHRGMTLGEAVIAAGGVAYGGAISVDVKRKTERGWSTVQFDLGCDHWNAFPLVERDRVIAWREQY